MLGGISHSATRIPFSGHARTIGQNSDPWVCSGRGWALRWLHSAWAPFGESWESQKSFSPQTPAAGAGTQEVKQLKAQ